MFCKSTKSTAKMHQLWHSETCQTDHKQRHKNYLKNKKANIIIMCQWPVNGSFQKFLNTALNKTAK